MAGYTKLFSSIVNSTIWRQENHIRLVWVTMLAMVDKDGIVEASLPGLADLSRVTIDQCSEAIDHLSSPDEYSRTKEHDGRRIMPVDGGWYIYNYGKYRDKLTSERAKEMARLRQKRHRDRNAAVTLRNADVTPNQQASSSSSSSSTNNNKNIYSAEFDQFWAAYPKKIGKFEAFKAWKQKKANLPDVHDLISHVKKQAQSKQWKDGFIPNASTWLRGRRWEDDMSTVAQGKNAPLTAREAAYRRQMDEMDDVIAEERGKIDE